MREGSESFGAPFAAGMTFRVEDEERENARNVPRLVNGFDTKKRIRLICL